MYATLLLSLLLLISENYIRRDLVSKRRIRRRGIVKKMSRAKEIREKLALQTKLQLSFRDTNSRVLGWLDNTDSTKTPNDPKDVFTKAEFEDSRQAFYRLPVVQIGAGLNFENVKGDDDHTEEDIHTVGEFINSDKKVSSLSKKKKRGVNGSGTEYGNRQQSDSIYRVAKNDTKAMVALKRKMRKTHRENIRSELAQSSNNNRNSNSNGKAVVSGTKTSTVTTRLNNYNYNHNASDSDSDNSDDGRSKRKQIGLLFQSKKKK